MPILIEDGICIPLYDSIIWGMNNNANACFREVLTIFSLDPKILDVF